MISAATPSRPVTPRLPEPTTSPSDCDDIHATVAELQSRGVEFDGPIIDEGFGLVTHFTMPGGVRVQLYEPKYQKRSP